MCTTPFRRLAAILFATSVWTAAGLQSASASVLDADEARCQARTIGGARVFVGAKLACLRTCAREALAGRVPPSDCRPPYAGTAARCVASREARALRRLEGGSCASSCPTCYAGGDCTAAAAATVARIEAAIDVVAPMVFCDESGSPDGLTRAEQACTDHIAAELRRFVLHKFQCLQRCTRRAQAGTIAAAACTPPLESNPQADPDTLACITAASARSIQHIDGTCQRDDAALECHLGRVGADWAALAGGAVDVEATTLLCGSASGAFVD